MSPFSSKKPSAEPGPTPKQEQIVTIEVLQLELEYAYKERQLMFSFGKFLLGTVLLGFVATITNYQIHTTTLQMKEKESQREYVSKFISQALDTNIEKRYQFAHYFFKLLGDPWGNYFQDISTEFEKKNKELEVNTHLIGQKRAEIDTLVSSTQENSIVASLVPKLMEADALHTKIQQIQNEVLPRKAIPMQEVLSSGWVYIGRKDKEKWLEKTVVENEEPQTGRSYTLNTRTYLRDTKPSKIFSGAGFVFGRQIRTLPEGYVFLVREIWVNPTNNAYWAKIETL